MASILRSSKFTRYFAGFTKNFVFNTHRETGGNLFQHSQSLSVGFCHGFASTIPKTDQNLERSLKKIDQDVRRSGRISRRDIEDVLEDIRQQRAASSSQSLLVIRCCGNLVPEELPEVRTALVQEIWRTLNKLKVPMDISHYNALLRVYLENEHSFKPTEFLLELEAKGVEPNRVTYQRLIQRYCQLGDIEGATKILEFMREKQLPINEHVFNALIMGHSQADDMESAFGILGVMKQAGLEPSADTYTILLCSYAKNGDLASIESTLNDCDKNDIILLDKDILDIVYELSINGHADKIDSLLSRIRKMVGYNQDAVNIILRLTNKGQADAAFKILKTMTRNTRNDGELIDTGNFFIKQMVKVKIPTENILSICKEMEEQEMNSRATIVAIEAALVSGLVDVSMSLLKEIKQNGHPIRQHYFWPLLCSQAKQGTENVLNVIKIISSDFNITLNGETLRDYVIPHLNEKNSDKIITLLKSVGISTASATTSMVYHILNQGNLKQAAELANNYELYYQPGLFRKPLISALLKSNDFESYISFVRQLHDCMPRLDQLIDRRNNEEELNTEDGQDTESHTQSEVLGQLVYDALIHFGTEKTVAVANILDGLVHQGLTISSHQAEKIQDKLGSNFTDEISVLLGKLTTGELEPIPIERTQTTRSTGFAQMTPEQLERTIETFEAKGENTKGLKRILLSACFKAKDLKRAENAMVKLETEDFVLMSGIYAQLIDLYCHHEDIEKTLSIYSKIKAKESDFTLDDLKTIKVATLLLTKNRIDEAFKFLEENKKSEAIEEERNFNYITTCWRLLNTLAEAGKVEELNRLFETLITNNYIEPSNVLLGPLVKVHIVNKDLDKAMNVFEEICSKYNCTPWKNDLACKLIQAEDAVRLQRLTDLSTNIHGEVNSLYDLVFSFVECGRIRQARKILETPGLRSRSQRINFACERYRQEGMVEPLEGLIEATKDLNHIDRSDIFYNLLLSYKKDIQPDKALGLWTKMQEEDITPSDKFLHTLGTFLKSQNMNVPFSVQEMPTPKTQALPRKSTNEDATVSSQSKLRNKSVAIETLIKQERLSEATKSVLELLHQNSFPILRIFRFYLNKIAAAGDIETMKQIGRLISSETKKIISFDNRLCQTYLTAGKSEEFLNILEAKIDQAKADQELGKIAEEFPRGGAIGILDNQPELLEKYEKIAEKYAEKNILAPINILWINHFINNNTDAANKIWNKYLVESPRIMFQKILIEARTKKDEQLAQRLIDQLKQSKTPEAAVGIAYSCLLDVYAAKGEFDKGLKTIEVGIKDTCLENFNRTALMRIKSGVEQAGNKFPYAIPEKSNSRSRYEDNSSSSSSSSGSSSDEEPIEKSK